jgi:hypothetical protein
MNNTDADVLAAQLAIGKQVLDMLLDLASDENKEGAVVPLDMNGRKFTLTIAKDN